ncbi:ABC transporter substrate-binding protein [Bosea sp. 2RAB26]|uniref:ABC transporter substrate-binding protein n=1 Tax=Bosea sp. 2RAB26 TaxID=3237476 RepID=UPI003F8DC3E1
MLRRLTRAALAGSFLLGLAVAPGQAATPKDVFVMASDLTTFITFDPAAANESFPNELLRQMCTPLLSLDHKDPSKVVAGIAETWSSSPDGKTWTFALRRGMVFPSGNAVTSSSIAWAMRRSIKLNLVSASLMRDWGLTSPDQIATPDDHTLVITLAKDLAPSVTPFAFTNHRMGSALDRDTIMAREKDGDLGAGWLNTNVACYGPYRLNTLRAQEVAILEANPTYWKGAPAMKRIIVRHVPEPGAQRLLLEKNDIDYAKSVEASSLAAMVANPELRFQFQPRLDSVYLALNQKDPILSNPKVIEAFRYLIDYQGLKETVQKGRAEIRQSFVPAGVFGALPKGEDPYRLDIAKAKALLTEAGYGDGFKKTVLTMTNYPFPDLAQNFQQNAAKVGVTLDIRTMATAQLYTLMRSRDFQMLMAVYDYDYPDANDMALRMAYNPDNSDAAKATNFLAWRAAWAPDAWFKQQVEAAQVERDPAKRTALYAELQRRHMREAPIIGIFQRLGAMALHKRVKRFEYNGSEFFYDTIEKE